MEVTVLEATPNPIETISLCAGVSYKKDNVSSKRVETCIKNGHWSVIEFAHIIFEVKGVSRACYDKETEILTESGWKYFKDVTIGERVLTFNPEKKKAEFQPVKDIIQYKYNGDMHYYHSQPVNLLVTPNHQMWIKKYDVRTPVDFNLVPSEDINIQRFYFDKCMQYKDIVSSDFILPEVSYFRKNNQGGTFLKTLPPRRLNRKDVMKFLAWFISEGSMRYSKKDHTWRISISQLKKKNYPNIEYAFSSCGLAPTRNFQRKNGILEQTGYKCGSYQWGEFLQKCGKGASNKRLPFDNLFEEFDAETAKIFIDEYMLGDGSIDKNGCGKIYTSSPILADQLFTLCYMAGYTATKTVREERVGMVHAGPNGEPIRNNLPAYVLYVSLKGKKNYKPLIKKKNNFNLVDYHDMVYCVTVPNHIIFVRRSGKAIWCGNCTHQLVRHRLNSYIQESQRYVRYKDLLDTDDWYVTPPEIASDTSLKTAYDSNMRLAAITYETLLEEGVKPEDARYVLPNAAKTNINVGMNARSLFNFLDLRLDSHSQWEIRELANNMVRAARQQGEEWNQLLDYYFQTKI